MSLRLMVKSLPIKGKDLKGESFLSAIKVTFCLQNPFVTDITVGTQIQANWKLLHHIWKAIYKDGDPNTQRNCF